MSAAGDHADAPAAFDAYAGDYERALAEGLSLSGEDSTYFARGRAAWVGHRLDELGAAADTVLDFGCGTGTAAPFLLDELGAGRVTGIDPSAQSVRVAQSDHGSERTDFMLPDDLSAGEFDLAYCNGVFHHIEPPGRPGALRYVHRALRPGGLFAFWENSPWNPGTRLVMRRIPFDRDAKPISAPRARRLLRAEGFEVIRTDFMFVFPRGLAALRGLEGPLARLPLGAQYMVLARKGG